MSSNRGPTSAAAGGGRRGRSAARGVVDSQARPTPASQPPATASEPHYSLANSLGIYHTAHQQGHLPAYSRPMSSHESMSPSMLSSFQSQQQQQSPPSVRYSVRDVYGQLLYHVPLAHGRSVKQVSVDVVIAVRSSSMAQVERSSGWLWSSSGLQSRIWFDRRQRAPLRLRARAGFPSDDRLDQAQARLEQRRKRGDRRGTCWQGFPLLPSYRRIITTTPVPVPHGASSSS